MENSSVRFHRRSYLLRSYIPCSLQSAGEFRFVFRPVILRIHGDLCPNEMSGVAPVVEQNALFECLASGRNYDDIMLAIGVGKRLGPVELERLQLQCIQSNEKLRCPLKTESPFSRSHIDEQVLKAGYPYHMPLAAQFQSGHVCNVCDSPSVIRFDAMGVRRESPSQGN